MKRTRVLRVRLAQKSAVGANLRALPPLMSSSLLLLVTAPAGLRRSVAWIPPSFLPSFLASPGASITERSRSLVTKYAHIDQYRAPLEVLAGRDEFCEK